MPESAGLENLTHGHDGHVACLAGVLAIAVVPMLWAESFRLSLMSLKCCLGSQKKRGRPGRPGRPGARG